MTERDDYPALAALADNVDMSRPLPEAIQCYLEVGQLRSRLASLLTPIVILVTPETLAALDDYVTVTQSFITNDAPDVEDALAKVAASNGWAPSMLIGGSLLAESLGTLGRSTEESA